MNSDVHVDAKTALCHSGSEFQQNSSGKYAIRGLILAFSVSARPKSNIQFNGREYANADEMPVDVRAAYDRVADDPGELHSGARLAAKLNAKIIVNGNEFNNAGEMSVDDRHLYHEALEALFPPGIAVSAGEALEDNGKQESPIVGALRRCFSRGARVLRLKR